MTVRIQVQLWLKEGNILQGDTDKLKFTSKVMTGKSLDRQMECLISGSRKRSAIMDTGNYFS